MKLNYETMLNEEIENQFKFIKNMDTTTEEGVKASKCLNDLIDRSIKIKELKIQEEQLNRKNEDDYALECEKNNLEHKKIQVDKLYRLLDLGLKLTIAGASAITYYKVAKYSLMFEKDDTASFSTTRDVLKKGLSAIKLF